LGLIVFLSKRRARYNEQTKEPSPSHAALINATRTAFGTSN
jgi:hypothetical protein